MAAILGIDAGLSESSAALVLDGVVCSEASKTAEGSAEVLLVLIDEVLRQAKASWKDISSIAVGIGPGSFTGIRNGISTVQGLATRIDSSSKTSVIGVSNLLAVAWGVLGTGERAFISSSANKQENFLALFESSSKEFAEFLVLSPILVSPISEKRLSVEIEQWLEMLPDAEHFSPGFYALEACRQNNTAAGLVAQVASANIAVSDYGFGVKQEREELFQRTLGGRGLKPLYAKPVQAKTLVERGLGPK